VAKQGEDNTYVCRALGYFYKDLYDANDDIALQKLKNRIADVPSTYAYIDKSDDLIRFEFRTDFENSVLKLSDT